MTEKKQKKYARLKKLKDTHKSMRSKEESDSSYESDSYYDSESDSGASTENSSGLLCKKYSDENLVKLFFKFIKRNRKKVQNTVNKQAKMLMKLIKNVTNIDLKISNKLKRIDLQSATFWTNLNLFALSTDTAKEKKKKEREVKLIKRLVKNFIRLNIFLSFAISQTKIKLKSKQRSINFYASLALYVSLCCKILDLDDLFHIKLKTLMNCLRNNKIHNKYKRIFFKDINITKILNKAAVRDFKEIISSYKFIIFEGYLNEDDEFELDKLYKILNNDNKAVYDELDREVDLRRFYQTVKYHSGVENYKQAKKKLTHKKLKSYGLEEEDIRIALLTAINPPREFRYDKRIRSSSESSLFQSSGAEDSDKRQEKGYRDIVNLLVHHRLNHHINKFESISTFESFAKLQDKDFKRLGIEYQDERTRLLAAIKKSSCNRVSLKRRKNPIRPVEKILKKLNLSRYEDNFKTVRSLKQASLLTHTDLKDLGVSMHSDRQSLIRIFGETYEGIEVRRRKLFNKINDVF